MGYRNNQFYQLGEVSGATFEESTLGRKKYNYFHPSADNPRFIYPDRTVRTYEVDTKGDLVSKREVLKRGFIRSIARTSGEEVKKCQFQFNPQTISQDVSMTEGLLNFFQQDPGQYAQPMAGHTNMAFTLMFDRSMEINNPVGSSFSGKPGATRNAIPGSQAPNSRSPWETGDPQYVGVLRDIAALYGVVGQGVSQADVQGRISEIQAAIKAETIGDEDLNVEDVNKSLEQVQTVLDVNIGNYALLVPRPVRVVLSSLYMVEGFVTATSVTFTKFNTAYVPIQAVVNVTMRAMHVGFAKKDTFLTYSLDQAEQIAIEQKKEENVANRDTYAKVQEDLSDFIFQIMVNGGFDARCQDFEDVGGTLIDRFYFDIENISGSGSLDNVKDLMDDGGATLRIWANWKMFTDLVDPSAPIGSEKASPRAWQEWLWTASNKDEIKDRGDLGGGGRFFSSDKNMRKFTPGQEFGGQVRIIYEMRVEIDHNGAQVRGYGRSTKKFNNDQAEWDDTLLNARVPMAWSYFGDTISGTPVVGSGIELS
jgi:hypothetical protein